MRGYELIALFGFAGNLSVDLVVNVNFIHEVLANVAQKLMQIRVVVVDVARIWRMVARGSLLPHCSDKILVSSYLYLQ